jgi:hypothetical protein
MTSPHKKIKKKSPATKNSSRHAFPIQTSLANGVGVSCHKPIARSGEVMRISKQLNGFRNVIKIAKKTAVAVAFASAIGQVPASELAANEPVSDTVAEAKVTVSIGTSSEVAEARVVLAELVRLRQPVKLRVSACEGDLVAARRDVVAAIRRHEAAQAAADEALLRVEKVTCVLRGMCQTIEVNGAVYTKAQVAEGLRRLIDNYQSNVSEVEAAATQLECSSDTLRQIAARVVKWQTQEQRLYEQINMLKSKHIHAKEDRTQTARATALVAEVAELLAKPTAPSTAVQPQSSAVDGATPADDQKPVAHPKDRLLQEVDSILSEKVNDAAR